MPVRFWSTSLVGILQFAALRGCTALGSWDWQSSAIANPTPQAQPCERWGDGRGLSPEQAIALRNLSWPQSYAAVINRLSYPDCRSGDWDLYKLPSGGQAKVYYSGAIATSSSIPTEP